MNNCPDVVADDEDQNITCSNEPFLNKQYVLQKCWENTAFSPEDKTHQRDQCFYKYQS